MKNASIHELSSQVIKYVLKDKDLPEPYCYDPTAQALRALWVTILRPGKNHTARLAALKEYFDRVLGKATLGGNDAEGLEEINLSRLTPTEQKELIRLLSKAKGVDESD